MALRVMEGQIWQKLKSFKSYTLSEQQKEDAAGLGHLIFSLL